MAFSNSTRKIRANGDGIVTAFSYPFKIFLEGDLEVFKVNTTTKVATLQVITTDYTVVINESSEGGTVTYVVAPTASEESFIRFKLPESQLLDLETGGNLPEQNIEDALDRMVKLAIEHNEERTRSILFATTSTTKDILMPEPESDKFWSWNNAATALQLRTADEILNLTGALAIANNLSDLADDNTARNNIFEKLVPVIVNNQVGAVDVVGWLLNSSNFISGLYLVYFKRPATTTISAWAIVSLNFQNAAWETPNVIIYGGDNVNGLPAGITLTITVGGQVQYTSSNEIGGTNGVASIFQISKIPA